ncbi:hypothetical protein [Cellulomonas telluris]|uniref:hypothetical protein n=1 Tax=Cellulomonas telluris TaxID=2306636 RepID=UPI0014562CF1|nr:hypothetical protein [Cellulomonas telluris]
MSHRRSRTTAVALLLALVAALLSRAGPVTAAVDPSVTGQLSLFERIENRDTGASEGRRELWSMRAVSTEDPAYTFEGNGLNGVQQLTVPAGGYTISESGGVPGYASVEWECGPLGTFSDPTPTITVPAAGSAIRWVRSTGRRTATGASASTGRAPGRAPA